MRESAYFNIVDPSFVIDSEAVLRAREKSWYVRTNYGLAVLRYREVAELLRDRRLKQGSAAWPAHHGVGGPLADWWSKALLNLKGDDHARLRRLLNPVFAPKAIGDMAPRFRALGNELIDAFAPEGRCEFVSQFAEPYAARVIALLLGIPEREWPKIAQWGTDLGLALSIAIREELTRIEAALDGLYGFADELIADRRREPKADFVTRLAQAEQDEDRLSHDELRVSLVLLIFGGVDTTRNQLGLAMQTFLQRAEAWRRVAEQPELAEAAVQEIMRLNPTITWVTREAIEDFEFRGVEIAKGTTIHLFSQSAGSDPRVFENSDFRRRRRAPPPSLFRRRPPPLHRPLRGAHGHGRGTRATRAAPARACRSGRPRIPAPRSTAQRR